METETPISLKPFSRPVMGITEVTGALLEIYGIRG